MGKCQRCGKDAGFMYSMCNQCIEQSRLEIQNSPGNDFTPTASQTPQTRNPAVRRYVDAYRVAAVLVTIGDALKWIGGVGGFLIFLVLSKSSSPFNSGSGGLELVMGGSFAAFFFVLGVLVSAQGQVLRATLDTAVSASRFLTDEERAVAMGLPPTLNASSASAS